jgi:hypothetical protein
MAVSEREQGFRMNRWDAMLVNAALLAQAPEASPSHVPAGVLENLRDLVAEVKAQERVVEAARTVTTRLWEDTRCPHRSDVDALRDAIAALDAKVDQDAGGGS